MRRDRGGRRTELRLVRIGVTRTLQCIHQGEGRVAWPPHVTHAERVDGKPRQLVIDRGGGKSRRRVIDRPPTIRTCCIADSFRRAAWWHHVIWIIGDWEDRRGRPEVEAFARDKDDILRKLLELAPDPTPEGQAEFGTYRLEKEVWWKKEGEREHYEERRAREEYAQAWRDLEDRIRAMAGVGPGATVERIKDAYRARAKVHLSDLGGGDEAFVRLKRAYDRAMRLAGKASA